MSGGLPHLLRHRKPLEIVVASTEQGNGVIGVIDGFRPKGIEDQEGRAWRKELLQKFGYKL